MPFDFSKAVPVQTGLNEGFDFSKAVPVEQEPIEQPEFSVYTEEERESIAKKGKIGWAEAAIKSDEWENIPFSPTGVVRSTKTLNAVNNLKKNEYESENDRIKDETIVTDYLKKVEEENIRGYSWGAKVYKGVTQLPGFMLEFIATGGAAALGKKAVKEGAKKLLGEAVEKGAGRAAVAVTATAAGAAARAPYMYNRYIPKYGERQIMANVALTDKGVKIFDEAKEAPYTSFMKAFGDTVIEAFSEEAGGVILKPLGGMAARAFPKKLVGEFRKTISQFMPNVGAKNLMTKAGYHGVLEEMGEERIGDFLRAMFSIEEAPGDNRELFTRMLDAVPDWEQLSVELAIFSVPGATNYSARKLDSYLQRRGLNAQARQEIDQNLSQTEKEELLEEVSEDRVEREPDEAHTTTAFKESYRNVVNRMAPIEDLAKEAEARGEEVGDVNNPQLMARQYLGVGQVVEGVLRHSTFEIDQDGEVQRNGEGLKPILDSFDNELSEHEPDYNDRRTDLEEYLVAQRIITDLAPREDVLVTDKQKKKAVQDMMRLGDKYGEDISILEGTSNRIYEYQKRVLHTLVQTGNMSEEQYNDILKKNSKYIPFQRVMDDKKVEVTPQSKNRFTKAKAPVEKIKGSELELENVLESVVGNTIAITNRAYRNRVAKAVAGLEELFPERIQSVDKIKSGKQNIIDYYEDGKIKHIEVSPELYQAMTGMDETQLDMFVKILSVPAQILRTGATITPEFMMRNFFRDQFTAAIQTNVGFRPFIDSAFGLADVMKKTDIYYEWLQSGAAYSGLVETSRDGLAKAYKELTKKPNMLKKLNIISTLQDMSQVFEQATRIGIYKAAKRKGLSSTRAAFESREGTLDFNVRGAKTKNVNALKAFFNAQVQAADKFVRTYQKNPVATTTKGLAYITAPSVLLYLVNRLDPEYDQLPRWQKDLFWNVKVNNTWVRIPKPFGLGQVFGTTPERFMEYLEEKDASAFEGLASALYQSLSPVASPDIIIPTAFVPVVENISNYRFFTGSDVVPEYMKKRLPKDQYSKYTSETSKILGSVLNFSPNQIENLIKGYTGTSGKYALEASDTLVNSIRGKGPEQPKEVADLPVIRGFVGRSPEGFRSQQARDFKSIYNKAEQVKNSIAAAKKEGDVDGVAKMKAEYSNEVKSWNSLKNSYKKMKANQKEVDKILVSDLPLEEKRDRKLKLEKEITKIARDAIKKFKGGSR